CALHCPSKNEVLHEQRAGSYSTRGHKFGEEMLRSCNQRSRLHRQSSQLGEEAQANTPTSRTKCQLGEIGQPSFQEGKQGGKEAP
ncbi:hypothetical protein A2U01_0083362, partial [Trifolium medium]|nr:hypothetical protein [Trifolium medium]